MFQKQGFCDDGASTARDHDPDCRDHDISDQDKPIPHAVNNDYGRRRWQDCDSVVNCGKLAIRHGHVLRARWRNGFDKPAWLSPDAAVPIAVEIEATHNYFPAGHRLRLDISSSSFPMWERNLNTGGPNYSESKPVVATNTLHHSTRYPSALVLQAVPVP